ncbi:hypothetical protein DFJ58DRAFT_733860 [Suillus subalutaceus]|uniref:uncharacterized protein n=1 Tax=Suillus subalutaceus TaxID=48586 RepID=UPI001B873E16|nr:uncharacterized protein DFJ58DRAFT_733860 [Suillus subalutaceus]KAG1838367.1 hypothetical protein DFJ58DRAFT_733860 [Suillus subalutaceus]
MNNVNTIDLVHPPIFNPHKWIGKGRIFDIKTLPQSVLDARSAALVIPPTYIEHIPSPDLSVTDFLNTSLPTRSPTIVTVKTAWRKSEEWLSSASKTGEAAVVMAHARDLFPAVPWKGNGGRSIEFTNLLGMGWIMDELIDLMMTHLARRARAQFHIKRIFIANSRLSEAIKGVTPSGNTPPLLSKCQDQIVTLHYELLMFPVHVHGNHWIAIAVNFDKQTIAIGDSLRGQILPPNQFMKQLQCWLLHAFKVQYSVDQKGMACALQNDTYSCPKKLVARATWFTLLARDWLNDRDQNTELDIEDIPDTSVSAVLSGSPRVDKKNSLSYILNITPSDTPSDTPERAPSDTPPNELKETTRESVELPKGGLLNWLNQVPKPGEKRTHSKIDLVYTETLSLQGQQRKKAKVVVEEHSGGPVGMSQSATASRDLRAVAKSGQFKPCLKKMGTWKKKIIELDPDAVAQDDCQTVRHSKCGRTIKVKEPYDVSRFREHVTKKCAQLKLLTPAAGTPTVTQWTKKFDIRMKTNIESETSTHSLTNPTLSTPGLPCPGITLQNEPLIENYLTRTAGPWRRLKLSY